MFSHQVTCDQQAIVPSLVGCLPHHNHTGLLYRHKNFTMKSGGLAQISNNQEAFEFLEETLGWDIW